MFLFSLKRKLYSIICCINLLIPLCAVAQNELLEIHHINVEDGDATMIVIHDTASNTFPVKVLIDGGIKTSNVFLATYFKNYFNDSMPLARFKYVILSHHHNDHYNGFKYIGRRDFIQIDTIIDVGGYPLGNAYAPIKPPDSSKADYARGYYAKATSTSAKPMFVKTYLKALKMAYDSGLLKSRSSVITSFPRDIGKSVTIGTVNGVPVTLTCVTGAAYAYGRKGDSVYCGVSASNSPNDYSLGFVLQYGEFRYLSAGDLGGENGGNFRDQETVLAGGLDTLLHAFSYSYDSTATKDSTRGHICAFKASHHGSDHSSNATFLRIRPAVAVISAGSKDSWGLPHPDFQRRLDTTWIPLSNRTSATRPFGISDRGFYATNLYDFNYHGGNRDSCRKYAVQLFANRDDTYFSYGNDYDAAGAATTNMTGTSKDRLCKDNYILKVEPLNITTQCTFYLYRTNYAKGVIMAPAGNFQCHRNTP
ncbi:MAG TPA: MBL fold metallo-hydrolase [Chitinophaga sp.]|uniref:ComEC/Rec2 family competence protein n=1 Tax=Chitinophaga sp. TaxID=1869181 RepID=UPI002C56B129|nr:MBL fold metallo-hydrolase [Chitinophaga sp.]HVI47851.1 MBL fold metallo-hydrolase [Chitinophaga sp.]